MTIPKVRKAILVAALILIAVAGFIWATTPIMITGSIKESEEKYARQVEKMKEAARADEGGKSGQTEKESQHHGQ